MLGFWVIVIIAQVLGKYMIIGYLDPFGNCYVWGKEKMFWIDSSPLESQPKGHKASQGNDQITEKVVLCGSHVGVI